MEKESENNFSQGAPPLNPQEQGEGFRGEEGFRYPYADQHQTGYYYPYHTYQPQQQSNPIEAVLALVFGIIGLFCQFQFSIAAIILGYMAMKKIDESNNMLPGRGMAKGGLILGIVGLSLLFSAILIWILIFVFALSLPLKGIILISVL